MGNALKPGGLDPWEASVAKQIEDEFDALLQADGLPGLSMDASEARDRRRLFVAIARGICKHLNDNPAAFRVRARNTTIPLARIDIDPAGPPP